MDNLLQWKVVPAQLSDSGPGAGGLLEEVIAAVEAAPATFTERDALKAVEQTLERVKAASHEEQLAFLFRALGQLRDPGNFSLQLALKGMTSAVLRGGLRLSSMDALRLVEMGSHPRLLFPYKALLSALQTAPQTPALADGLRNLRPMIDEWHGKREMEDIRERIDKLLDIVPAKPLEAAASWSRRVFADIDASAQQLPWRALLLHVRELTQSTASRKWQEEAVARIGTIGREEFVEAAHRWLALGPMPEMPQTQVPESEADYQKGFLWAIGALGETSLCPDIADFAFHCFRKIPMIGAVSHRVGNACVNALAAMPGLEAVSQLSRLAARVKYDVARRLIEKALVEAARKNNVSREDLEAMSVPAFGLDGSGTRRETAGDSEAILTIEDGAAVLTWRRDGKPLKGAPAEVKEKHPELAAELKKAAKELDATLATTRIRLERLLLSDAATAFEAWRSWYLEHPVTSVFARRLIWEIEANSSRLTAIWWNGALVDWSGNAVAAGAGANVRLWHPVRSDLQTILCWRCFLEDRGIRQPFKQAHREVYLLTTAERETRTYSNRFASHVIKQHQFAALCRERGWQFHLMGNWDSHNTPFFLLPQYHLRAEFDVEFPANEEATAHGVYLVIATDRVQFVSTQREQKRRDWPPAVWTPEAIQQAMEGREPVPLEMVPAVVFSEVLRDCDLFVGVTSIGTDPEWNVQRPAGAHADYWSAFAFGELSTAAENRKGVIEGLVPKLAIGERCRVEGRFLCVRGEWNEYRIHLGSGNVLMEPGSRYLCIVQGPGDRAASVPLPFEGDRTLSLILSKAFLLANDRAIQDPTILKQIRP